MIGNIKGNDPNAPVQMEYSFLDTLEPEVKKRILDSLTTQVQDSFLAEKIGHFRDFADATATLVEWDDEIKTHLVPIFNDVDRVVIDASWRLFQLMTRYAHPNKSRKRDHKTNEKVTKQNSATQNSA